MRQKIHAKSEGWQKVSLYLSLSSLLSAKAKEFKGAKVRPEKH